MRPAHPLFGPATVSILRLAGVALAALAFAATVAHAQATECNAPYHGSGKLLLSKSCPGLAPASARHLVRRYGQRAADVANYIRTDPELAQPVTPGEPDLRAEFAYQRDHEMALQPADHLLRRTRLGLFHPALLREKSE